MTWEAFRTWIVSDPAPGWITCAITVAGGAIGLVLKRARPQHVVVREVSRTSLLPTQQGTRSRIKSTFDDVPVGSLFQIALSVENAGSKPIAPLDLTFSFAPKSRVLAVDELRTTTGASTDIDRHASVVRVHRPYLNPRRDHSEAIHLAVVLDGDDETLSVGGGGEGWSVRLVRDDRQMRAEIRSMLGPVSMSATIALTCYVLSRSFEPSTFTYTMQAVSFLAFLYAIVWFTLVIKLIGTWQFRRNNR